MTAPNDDANLTDTARTLTASVEAMSAQIETFAEKDRKRRTQLVILAVSVLFDIALSIALGIVAYQASEASDRATAATTDAKQAEQRDLAACEAGNQANKDQLDLWHFVFSFPAPEGETVEQRALREKQAAEFQTYINRVFAPKDCTP